MSSPSRLDASEHEPLTLSALWTYPIKSAGGVGLQRSEVVPRGLKHDRRWMLTGSGGEVLTQRQFPQMRQIRVSLLPDTDVQDALLVEAPGMLPLRVPRRPQGPLFQTHIWNDAAAARCVSPTVSAWFSTFLNTECQLLYMPDDAERAQSGKPFSSLLSFADGNPFHLVTEGSVADLNTRLARQVCAGDFRPNLVISGGLPYAEDHWRLISVGGVRLRVVESCARCGVLNVTDDARTGAEPLRTLAGYRRQGQAIQFGQNVMQGADLHRAGSFLQVGTPVVVEKTSDIANPSYP